MTLAPDKQGAKNAFSALIAAVGGQEAAAGFCRVGQSKLSDYGNVNRPDAYPAIDVVIDLEAVTRGQAGAPHVTRYLARRAGFSLVPLPGAKPAGRSWNEHIAVTAKEAGDITSKLALAIDGGVSPREARELRREVAEALQAMVDLDTALAEVEGDTS